MEPKKDNGKNIAVDLTKLTEYQDLSKDHGMATIPAKDFRDLILWQKAHRFVLDVYTLTKSFPNFELYGLTSQIRRASVSIAANIAEGFKKRTLPEKIRLLNISQGSLEECRYYLILIEDLSYARTESNLDQLEEISKILGAYIKGIKRQV
jgi:four helix bundle protein